jgi:hypothetical protein
MHPRLCTPRESARDLAASLVACPRGEPKGGLMLRLGLQEIAGQLVHLPREQRLRPRSDLLEERYEMFRKVG